MRAQRSTVLRWFRILPCYTLVSRQLQADPEKKKASVRDSYKADPEKKKPLHATATRPIPKRRRPPYATATRPIPKRLKPLHATATRPIPKRRRPLYATATRPILNITGCQPSRLNLESPDFQLYLQVSREAVRLSRFSPTNACMR